MTLVSVVSKNIGVGGGWSNDAYWITRYSYSILLHSSKIKLEKTKGFAEIYV